MINYLHNQKQQNHSAFVLWRQYVRSNNSDRAATKKGNPPQCHQSATMATRYCRYLWRWTKDLANEAVTDSLPTSRLTVYIYLLSTDDSNKYLSSSRKNWDPDDTSVTVLFTLLTASFSNVIIIKAAFTSNGVFMNETMSWIKIEKLNGSIRDLTLIK